MKKRAKRGKFKYRIVLKPGLPRKQNLQQKASV